LGEPFGIASETLERRVFRMATSLSSSKRLTNQWRINDESMTMRL